MRLLTKYPDVRGLKLLAPLEIAVNSIELKADSILEKMLAAAGPKRGLATDNVQPKMEDNMIANVTTQDRISARVLSASRINSKFSR